MAFAVVAGFKWDDLSVTLVALLEKSLLGSVGVGNRWRWAVPCTCTCTILSCCCTIGVRYQRLMAWLCRLSKSLFDCLIDIREPVTNFIANSFEKCGQTGSITDFPSNKRLHHFTFHPRHTTSLQGQRGRKQEGDIGNIYHNAQFLCERVSPDHSNRSFIVPSLSHLRTTPSPANYRHKKVFEDSLIACSTTRLCCYCVAWLLPRSFNFLEEP